MRMLIDITLKITSDMIRDAKNHEVKALVGHLGTHFDVMNKEFPLDYTTRRGVIFDVSHVKERDIDVSDINLSAVGKDMFVAFYTGFIEEEGYGTRRYFAEHPQLSDALIDKLLEKNISIIGIDFPGMRRNPEHTPKDQYCADHGVFVVENLCNLNALTTRQGKLIVHTYPMNYVGMTGLPCRVVAEMDDVML